LAKTCEFAGELHVTAELFRRQPPTIVAVPIFAVDVPTVGGLPW
jgi:hypothetical protein